MPCLQCFISVQMVPLNLPKLVVGFGFRFGSTPSFCMPLPILGLEPLSSLIGGDCQEAECHLCPNHTLSDTRGKTQ